MNCAVILNRWIFVGAPRNSSLLVSRPAELPRQPLVKRYVSLSTHTASIRQTFVVIVSHTQVYADTPSASLFLAPIRQLSCLLQKNILLSLPVAGYTILASRQDPSEAVAFSIKLPDAALLHFHYRSFSTTTNGSAPVRSIGTQSLMVFATWESPLTSTRLVPAVP